MSNIICCRLLYCFACTSFSEFIKNKNSHNCSTSINTCSVVRDFKEIVLQFLGQSHRSVIQWRCYL